MRKKSKSVVFIQKSRDHSSFDKILNRAHMNESWRLYIPTIRYSSCPSIGTPSSSKAEPDFIVKSYQDHEDGWKLLSDAIKGTSLNGISPWKKWTSHSLLLRALQKHFPDIRFTVDLTPVVQQLRLGETLMPSKTCLLWNICR